MSRNLVNSNTARHCTPVARGNLRETTPGLSSLGVGSSPSGGHSLLARYPETLTSATQTYPPVEPARDVASAARNVLSSFAAAKI